MSDVDEVLERLVTDQAFRTQLRDDPVTALGGYDLDEEDVAVLAASLDEGQGGDRGVEQRTSKSAFLAAFAALTGSGGGGGGGHPDLVAPDDPEGTSAARSQCINNLKQIGLGLHDEDPIQDIATDADPAEVVHPTYPGIYVEEIPSPETASTSAPPDASLRSAEGEQPLPEGWPAKWVVPDTSEPPPAPDDEATPPQPGATDDMAPGDPTDAAGALDELAAPGEVDEDGDQVKRWKFQRAWPKKAESTEETELSIKVDPTLETSGAALGGDEAIADPDGAASSSYQDHVANEAVLAQPHDSTAPTASDVSAPEAEDPSDLEGRPGEEGKDSQVAMESVVIQNEGVDLEAQASVGSDETETVGANRDITPKGAKINEN